MLRELGRALIVGVFAAAAPGCVELGGEQLLLQGSAEIFSATVQPILMKDCASAACHGRASRPLALYSPGALRANPAWTFLDKPLTDDELRANMRRIVALTPGTSPAESPVVLKPLAEDAGGLSHAGGDVFLTSDDGGFQAILQWLQQAEQEHLSP